MYVLVAIVKKRLGLEADIYTFLQVLGLILFGKAPLKQILTGGDCIMEYLIDINQLNSFDKLMGQ